MRRFALLALLTMPALASCLFPSLTGLTGPGGDAANDTELTDAPLSDGPNVTDSQPANDAPSSDAADAGDASDAGGFCATHPGHTFCEDFDEPNFQTRWDNISASAGATLVADNSKSVSPPNEMLASVSVPANGSAHAYAMKHFTTANTIKIAAEMMVDTNTLATLDPLMIVFNPPPSGYTSYEIHIDTCTGHRGYLATLSDGGSLHVDTAFANTLQTWHNVEVDLNMSTAAIDVLLDGVPTVQWTVAALSPTAFDLRLGITTSSSTTSSPLPGVAHVDNVLVDVQ